jgi:hypothetical protein
VSLDLAASAEDPVFAFNPDAQIRVERIGQEANTVVVIDRVISKPEALVEFAARRTRFVPAAKYKTMYPGLMAGAPLPYVSALVMALHPIIAEAFGLNDARPDNARCNLCLVTQRPEQLGVMQRLPHVDTLDPTQFAILHYLCDERFGGTAFYRHRSTGFEMLDVERDVLHQRAVMSEVHRAPPPAAYIVGDTPLYAQTARFETKFNRLLIYRSSLLHCGLIPPGAPLSSDPRQGRLTSNVFVNYVRD